MTAVLRRKPPWCTCSGLIGYVACAPGRPLRHRHGDLEAQEKCIWWVCYRCERMSKYIYKMKLDEQSRHPLTGVRMKPASRLPS